MLLDIVRACYWLFKEEVNSVKDRADEYVEHFGEGFLENTDVSLQTWRRFGLASYLVSVDKHANEG
jgi:hypothetical protein